MWWKTWGTCQSSRRSMSSWKRYFQCIGNLVLSNIIGVFFFNRQCFILRSHFKYAKCDVRVIIVGTLKLTKSRIPESTAEKRITLMLPYCQIKYDTFIDTRIDKRIKNNPHAVILPNLICHIQ